jgi:hypothetical protein
LGTLNPLLGSRMYIGIWPPSKPFRDTPDLDFCPLRPRPHVLPTPDPGPLPTLFFVLKAPFFSLNSFNFILISLNLKLYYLR